MLVLYFICAVLYYKCCDIEYRDDNIRVLLSTLCIVQYFFLVLFVMNAILVYNTIQNEHFQSILNSERYLDECCGAAIITRVECVGPTILHAFAKWFLIQRSLAQLNIFIEITLLFLFWLVAT